MDAVHGNLYSYRNINRSTTLMGSRHFRINISHIFTHSNQKIRKMNTHTPFELGGRTVPQCLGCKYIKQERCRVYACPKVVHLPQSKIGTLCHPNRKKGDGHTTS